MYHGTPRNNPTSKYSIRTSSFIKHLDYLKKKTWHTAGVNDLSKPELLPNKTVILTFDDGYQDNYEGAFLPLLDHEMKATWFITTDCIDKHARWMGEENEETKMLSITQLKEMKKHGMVFQSSIGGKVGGHANQEISWRKLLRLFGRSLEILKIL